MKKIKILLSTIAFFPIIPTLATTVSCNEEKLFEECANKISQATNEVIEEGDLQKQQNISFTPVSWATYSKFKFLGEHGSAISLLDYLDDEYTIEVECDDKESNLTLVGIFSVSGQEEENEFDIKVYTDPNNAANMDVPAGLYPLSLKINEKTSGKQVFSMSGLTFELVSEIKIDSYNSGSGGRGDKLGYFPSISDVQYEETYVPSPAPGKTIYRPYVVVEYGGLWVFHTSLSEPEIDKFELSIAKELNWKLKTDLEADPQWIGRSDSCPGSYSIFCEYYIGDESDTPTHNPIIANNPVISFDVSYNETEKWSVSNSPIGVPFESTTLTNWQGDESTGKEPQHIGFDLIQDLGPVLQGFAIHFVMTGISSNIPQEMIDVKNIKCSIDDGIHLSNGEAEQIPDELVYDYNVSINTGNPKLFDVEVWWIAQDWKEIKETGELVPPFNKEGIYLFNFQISSTNYGPNQYSTYSLMLNNQQ